MIFQTKKPFNTLSNISWLLREELFPMKLHDVKNFIVKPRKSWETW